MSAKETTRASAVSLMTSIVSEARSGGRLRAAPAGYPVVDVSAGTRAMRANRYANLRAEMWGRMRVWLRTRGRIPDDRRLIDDLVSPLYSYDASNRV